MSWSNKPQNMKDMSVVLNKISSRSITETNRSAIMWGTDGAPWVTQLPTRDELLKFRAHVGNSWPGYWSFYCIDQGQSVPVLRGGEEVWSSTPGWIDHVTVEVGRSGSTQVRRDSDSRIVVLRTKRVDSDEVCLFEHGMYDGQYRCFGAGDHRLPGDFLGKASSIVAGKNCSARVYEKDNFTGANALFNEDRKNAVPQYWLGSLNDKVSSIKVRCDGSSLVGDSEACFFEYGDYSGKSICYGNGSGWPLGTYVDGSSAEATFSSMMLGKNCDADLIAFHMPSWTPVVSKTYKNAGASSTMKVRWLDDWNDRTTSLRIACR